MNKMRFAQGGVFLGASLLVIVVGLRGIHPDAIPLIVIYAALGLEAIMLVAIGILVIAGNGLNGNSRLAELHRTLDETDKTLSGIVTKLTSTAQVPDGVMSDVAYLKGRIGYMQGIVKEWQ